MKKILTDKAYKKAFKGWVDENLSGVEMEISSRLPMPRLCANQMEMGNRKDLSNFSLRPGSSEGLTRIMKKLPKAQNLEFFGKIAKL